MDIIFVSAKNYPQLSNDSWGFIFEMLNSTSKCNT